MPKKNAARLPQSSAEIAALPHASRLQLARDVEGFWNALAVFYGYTNRSQWRAATAAQIAAEDAIEEMEAPR